MNLLFGEENTPDYRLIASVEELASFVSTISSTAHIAVDTETSGLQLYRDDYVAGISLSIAPRQGVYIPIRHVDSNNLPVEEVRRLLTPILTSPTIRKELWNAKFDAHALASIGIFLNLQACHDGPLKLVLIDENIRDKSLKTFAVNHIERDADRYEQAVQRLCAQRKLDYNYAQLRATEICQYACADTDYTLRSSALLDPYIQGHAHLWGLYEIDRQLMEVLWWMERRGVYIDQQMLAELDTQLTQDLTAARHAAYTAAGCVFNVDSNAEIANQLYVRLGLPILERTKSGQGSTEKLILKRLRDLHPLPDKLIKYSRLSKLHGTYIKGILSRLGRDGMLHTTYNQSVARTHRLSSSGPNLQNIPRKDKLIRKMFALPPTEPDLFLLPIDQSQVELRVTAHYSQEPEWVAAFRTGKDLHAVMCARIFGVPLEEFSKDPVPEWAAEKRSLTKPCNFGELYGVTPEGLVDYLETWDLRVSQEDAEKLHNDWWAAVPNIKALFNQTVALCRKHGYIQNLFGAYRRLPEINSYSKVDREAAERQAFNFIIQGSCAWMLKIAMIKMNKLLQGRQTTLRLTVHDEVILWMHRSETALVDPLKRCMEDYPQLTVPIEANVSFSTTNWSAKKEIKA